MKIISLVAGTILLVAANAAGARTMPAGHQHHHPAGKAMAAADRCCCDKKDMHEMMSMMHDMMKMHGGMKMDGDMKMNGDMKPPAADQTVPQPDQHQH